MPELRVYAVFISHAWAHNDEYYRLERMLDEAPNFKWHNTSVPEHDPRDSRTDAGLEHALRDQIRPASVVLVLAGMYAAYSKWIQKEIDIAVEMGKPIIGVKPWGSERIPEAVSAAADTIVGWSTDSVVGAIRQYGG